MPNKIQRAARERQQKTGESYRTALMHVHAAMAPKPEAPPRVLLGPWVADDMPGVPRGTMTRLVVVPGAREPKPLIVAFAGNGWKVLLAPGTAPALVQGSFAAPTEQIARLYADDYLHANGFSGPGVSPLPAGYPPLRPREDARVPSRYEPSVLEQAAKCACGYIGEDIVSRYDPCPECGGVAVLPAERLLRFVVEDNTRGDGSDAPARPALSFGVRAFSRRWGRAETLTFTRTDDGWYISNGAHRHPTRPDGGRWGDKRAGGHRGLGFFLVNEDYLRASDDALAEVLSTLWTRQPPVAEARARMQALFV